MARSRIAERLEVFPPTVIACRKRYAREGLTGDLATGTAVAPQTVRRDRRAEILATTLSPPPPGA